MKGRPFDACDPALAALFTPLHSQYGRYEVCTATESPDMTAPADLHLAQPERLEALDVFGTAGTYDRSKLAYLFGGQRAMVLRGWRIVDGRFESLTLVSPYPDASLTRLNPGTMIIRWTANPPGQNGPTENGPQRHGDAENP